MHFIDSPLLRQPFLSPKKEITHTYIIDSLHCKDRKMRKKGQVESLTIIQHSRIACVKRTKKKAN